MDPSPPPRPPPGPPSSPKDGAYVVFAYAALASLWIIVSDAAVAALVDDPADVSLISVFKGWAFVALTSWALHVVLRRAHGRRDAHAGARRDHGRAWRWLAGSVALLVLVIMGGAVSKVTDYYQGQAVAQLRAVARMQASQVDFWLAEQRSDAVQLARSPTLHAALAPATDDADRRRKATLFAEFWRRHQAHGYTAAQVLDKNGARVFSTRDGEDVGAGITAAVRHLGAPGIVNIVDDDAGATAPGASRRPRAHLVTALDTGPGGRDFALVLELDLDASLMPQLARWPLPVTSAESLLVRPLGDAVAVVGRSTAGEGVVHPGWLQGATPGQIGVRLVGAGPVVDEPVAGVDPKSVPIVGLAEPVADTSWYLVATLAERELYARVDEQLFWASVAAALLLLLSVLGLFALGQRRALRAAVRRRAEEIERLAMIELVERARAERAALTTHYETMTRQARDIVLLVGPDRRIVEANDAAVAAYGYSADELRGLALETLRAPQTLGDFGDHWQATATTDGVLFTTEHRHRDGRVFPVEVSARAVVIGGQLFRQSFIRDISARRDAERRMGDSEERFRNIARAATDVVWEWDPHTNTSWWSDSLETVLGHCGQPTFDEWATFIHPEDRERIVEGLRWVLTSPESRWSVSYRVQRGDGSYAQIVDRGFVVRDGAGRALKAYGGMTDVTAQHEAQAHLDHQLAELRRWQEVTIGREDRVRELKLEVNALLRVAGHPPRYAPPATAALPAPAEGRRDE